MFTPIFRSTVCAVGMLAAAASVIAGPWESLFNGKDLTGWKLVNGQAPFTVVDGAIVGLTVMDSPNSFLATEKTYGDFIFECEIRQDVGPSNSGVMFRALSDPGHMEGRVHSYQMEIDPSERAWSGGIYDEARRGWLYPVHLNPSARSVYLFGQWNHLRIEAIGSSLRTWINGIPVSHVIDDMTSRGFLALQIHSIGKAEDAGRRVAWRNLRIQTTDLHPSPPDQIFVRNLVPNTVSEAERAAGWRLLWDGKTTQGWRALKGTAFPSSGWSIEDGVLSVLGKDGGHIVTEEEFSAFELQLEFLVTEGANSGIKYFLNGSGEDPAVGLEFQLLDDEKHPDAQRGAAGNRKVGSLYDLIPRDRMPAGLAIAPKAGVWQHARIVAHKDGRVEHWLNGIKVVEFDRSSPLFAALVARSKFAEIPEFGAAKQSGILLQEHGDVVRFRSIKVRSL